jgi:hypothetical protein
MTYLPDNKPLNTSDSNESDLKSVKMTNWDWHLLVGILERQQSIIKSAAAREDELSIYEKILSELKGQKVHVMRDEEQKEYDRVQREKTNPTPTETLFNIDKHPKKKWWHW